ncbi:hypothetical protein Trco_003799 [Trichoderma cornu-damae]|uniref:Myb-like domain-containing protein n=1 Tax=Trichoderma cornu-damae TaxID=654480 RepID=A0A9P8QLQ7_9HYPO|nr:hypothetical protein Trco_003799 [Trichoderma cornu-damae]
MDPATPEKSTSQWTEEAKFQFLLRIVAQLKEDGRAIKWEKINIPGRTIKSLQNMWTKINKQIADFEARESSGEGSAAVTPAKNAKKPRAPRKKKLAVMADLADDGVDDEDVGLKRALSKKRFAEEAGDEGSAAGVKRPKVKAEADEAVCCKKEEK